MDRPTPWKARLTLAIVAALATAPAPAALAAPPASDEYVLELPGVSQSDSGPVTTAPQPRGSAGDGVQHGVAGETDEPASPLSAFGDAVGSVPASLVIGLAALAALALLALVPLRRPLQHGTR